MKHLRKFNEEFETDDISQSLSDWWISCDEQLPENGQKVIVYAPKSQMSKINICTFEKVDESGNNRRPYRWKVQGPGYYFGQEVTQWMPIPDYPDSDYRV